MPKNAIDSGENEGQGDKYCTEPQILAREAADAKPLKNKIVKQGLSAKVILWP
jgi:hypothetical protein